MKIYRVSIDLSGSNKKKVVNSFKKKYPELFGILSSDKSLSKQFSVVKKVKETKEEYVCENCGSKNIETEIDYDDYDKYNKTTSVNLRGICQDCDFDNYIENVSTKLNDGTEIYND